MSPATQSRSRLGAAWESSRVGSGSQASPAAAWGISSVGPPSGFRLSSRTNFWERHPPTNRDAAESVKRQHVYIFRGRDLPTSSSFIVIFLII